MITAAQALVKVLLAEGVSHVFCVPGESFLAVLDALGEVKDRITVVTCRHESGAANMAAAHGKLTGRPGICMVTRGPGATHASVGVHTARQDSAPMILFVGQVARGHKGREAFQEMDYPAFFGSTAKWVTDIDDEHRIGELVSHGFAIALEGRMGPVVIALPEDMLSQQVVDAPVRPVTRMAAALPPAIAGEIATRLRQAERPMIILGGSGWDAGALAKLSGWIERARIPVALTFRRKDLIDNDHPCYAGDLGLGPNPALISRIRDADLILALGTRLGDIATQGYGLFKPDVTAKTLIHIHPDSAEIGRVWPCSIGAAADVNLAAEALCLIETGRNWSADADASHAFFENFSTPLPVTGTLNLSEVFHHLADALPPDAVVTNGAGNYAAWLHRFYRHRRFGTQLGPTSGAMGFGLPAAIAARIAHPQREAVAVAGDGCFLMTGQELATAMQYGVKVLVLVIDNGALATIRMHQERSYPGHVVATDLVNPDFVAFAHSFGAWGKLVERTEDFPAALAEARARAGVALLHLKTALRDIAPGKTL
jgi:acetolactate synthase I/II/III large subunit